MFFCVLHNFSVSILSIFYKQFHKKLGKYPQLYYLPTTILVFYLKTKKNRL